MDRKLKEKLNQYTILPYRAEALEETRRRARKISLQEPGRDMTAIRFFLDQLRFVRPSTWLMKAGVTILVLAYLKESVSWPETWLWTLVSVTGPLLCLINANELGGFFCRGMLEIQMTARYSLRYVFLARLIFFGIFDVFVFITVSVVMSASGAGAVWQVLLYSTVPYLMMCVGCLMIFLRNGEDNTLLYCAVWGGILTLAAVIVNSMGWQIYTADRAPAWLMIGAAALAGTVWQAAGLIKRTGGNVDEINIGTVV